MKKIVCALLALCMTIALTSCDKQKFQEEQYVVEKESVLANKPEVNRIIIPIGENSYYYNNETFSGADSYIAEDTSFAKADMFTGKLGIDFGNNKGISPDASGYVDIEKMCAAFGLDYMYNAVKNTAIITKRECAPTEIDESLIAKAKQTVLEKTLKIDEHCGYSFPEGSVYGVYEPKNEPGWVGGFYSGLNYRCENWSDNQIYKDTAENTRKELEDAVNKNDQTFTHDIGFTIYLSSYQEYLKNKDENAAQMTVKAADALLKRVKQNGGYIQAWGSLKPRTDGKKSDNDTRMIADTMCNLPVMFAASEITGDSKYKDAAVNHARLTQKFIMRKDATISHTFVFNDEGTGGVERTHQGAADDSCWARGTAWIILGMSQAYDATGDISFLNSAKELCDTYILRSEDDLIPRWDFIYQNNTKEPMDSSAASIAACGFYNIYQATGETFYKDAAYYIFESLYKNYSSRNDENSSGILYHATGHKPGNKNIDVCLIYGDYYFGELLARFGGENVGY